MAAATRCAARKIGQAGHRRLFPRFTGSTPAGNAAAAQPSISNAKVVDEIQKNKDELYELLARVERDKSCPSFMGRVRNIVLLQQLSLQVSTKPNDPKMGLYQKIYQFNVLWLCTTGIVAGSMFLRDKKEAPKRRMVAG